jgi:hypothetical protein
LSSYVPGGQAPFFPGIGSHGFAIVVEIGRCVETGGGVEIGEGEGEGITLEIAFLY